MSTEYVITHPPSHHYRIFASFKDEEMPDGTTTLRSQGCNGAKHVEDVIVAWLHADGEVEYAEPRETRELGVCDGTCGTAALGAFIFPTTFGEESTA